MKNMETNYGSLFATLDNNTLFLYKDEIPLQRHFFEHSHTHAELFIFLGGDAEMIIEEKAFPLHINDFILIPKGIRHFIQFQKSTPYTRMCFHVHKEVFESLGMQELAHLADNENVYTANLSNTPFINTLQNVAVTTAHIVGEKTQNALFYERLLSLYCSLPQLQENQSDPIRLLDKARLYIESNLDKELNLEILAENLFVSPAYLCKVFRKKTGVPVMHFVNEQRIRKAKQLILDGVPLKEVYLSCGYENYVTFFRVFRKQTGQTPSEFRECH